MKARKYIKRIPVVGLGIVFLLNLTIKYTLANEKSDDFLFEGLKKINLETFSLVDMKKIRFERLEKDLKEVEVNGFDNLRRDSSFYLLTKSSFSKDELDSGLKGTNLEGLGKDFKSAEEKYSVNAILLMAMAKHETGNGHSDLYENKNNLFGFNAIDSDPYNKASGYDTKKESIDDVARHLKSEYLDKNGAYYNGISTKAIGKSYATDPDWSTKVDSMMIEVANNMIETYKAGY